MTLIVFDMAFTELGKDQDYYCFEVSGLSEGTYGFLELYQDDRVGEHIRSIAKEKHGILREHRGFYTSAKKALREMGLPSNHESIINSAENLFKTEYEVELERIRDIYRPLTNEIWLGEKDCIIVNYQDDLFLDKELKYKTLNTHQVESVTRNKWMQMTAAVRECRECKIIPGSNYGDADHTIEDIINLSDYFIVKESSQSQAKNSFIITKQELIKESKKWKLSTKDIVEKYGSSYLHNRQIVQPYVNAISSTGQKYIIRSIVFEEEFIDAFAWVSRNDPIVNPRRGAKPSHITDKEKEIIAEISVRYAKDFENACNQAYYDSLVSSR